MRLNNYNQGVTLIELLIALAIISILLTTAFMFFMFGNKTFSMGTDQYTTQADLRIANDYIVKAIRFATAVELGGTPSSIAQTDKYDYIYLNGDTLVHSAYNNGNARIVRNLGSGLLGTTSFWSEKNLNSQMIGISIFGEANDQNFDLQSSIELPNIALKKSYISNTTGATSIKYIVDTSLSTPVTPPDDDDDDDDDDDTTPPTPVTIIATVIVKAPKNDDYRITLNYVSKIIDTNNITEYIANFTVFSNASYPLKIEKKHGNAWDEIYNGTFDVLAEDIAKEISF